MKKFKLWLGVGLISILGFIAISYATEYVQRFVINGSEIYSLDNSGNVSIAGTLSTTGAVTNSGDVIVTDDDLKFGTGVAVATTTTSGTSQGTIRYAYLGGVYNATEGSVLVATAPTAGQGITVIRAAAAQDYTAAVGIAASAVSTGSVVGFYTSGYVLALTTGTVNPGDTLVVSDLGTSGYLEADTTPTTGADVAVALGYGVSAGGLVKVLLYK